MSVSKNKPTESQHVDTQPRCHEQTRITGQIILRTVWQ